MFDHIADAIKIPDIVRLTDNVFVARFETMKVYSALAAVRHLLETGRVRRGDTLVDSSSGIYAYALAMACHKYGMKCHIVGSTTVDRTLRTQLEILGATVEQVRPSASLKLDQKQRVERIQEILRESEANPSLGNVYWMRQYHNDIHYLGYREFADIVRREIGVDDLTVVGGVGSGASTGGLVTALRETDPAVELVGIQPFGSVTFGSEHIEDPEVIIAGIGSSIPFRNVRHELYDTMHWVSFDHARSASVELLRRHAVFAGLSTGCCYLVTRWEARRRPDRRYLFIAADTGHRYLDHVFARHEDVLPIDELAPTRVNSLDELTFPWSVMAWDRRPHRAADTDADSTATPHHHTLEETVR
ncbi:cysteine synthase A [Streptoalloteichus tenebrarius]|uniref:Cysteine synthase A n=1 Tax=Streptoalloteichus tenebrarius (strain ATCC 17920 / DSM 40477 / JCM 4838 / CBS 697.72 / NBRC 16177 / NCIMB 11028 / NRRL B-12390 / A12253. 1 / ISP 5477) TaxID=1933 RepID=A0ABT1HQW2_STRSD|nr:pyridoxal-phosphate dependent enzyme [Streptoalloteichus tenebrarius]MCP2257840.1 cysteine synthase A [Streptoalloteichus tenebrarius]BFE99798.1 cysteine synthase family protein [Streptoalloteichus tenebrarius]